MGDENSEANSGEIIGRTLWGDPVYVVKRKMGRPPFRWTEENSFKVSMLLAAGWVNERIAGCVLDPRTGKPISIPTLKRHFRAELAVRDQARDMLRAKQLMAAAEQAFKGNVGAQRLLAQLIEQNDAMIADERARRHPARPEPKDEPVHKPGKKEQAAAAAAEAEERLALRYDSPRLN